MQDNFSSRLTSLFIGWTGGLCASLHGVPASVPGKSPPFCGWVEQEPPYPPKHQGPRPKIVVDPTARASSWSKGQENERAKSRCSQTTPKKASVMPPSALFSSGCGRQSVCGKYCCELRVLSHRAHTANHCYSEKNKAQKIFKKRGLFLFPFSRASGPR